MTKKRGDAMSKIVLPKICGGFLNLTQKCNLACRYCFVKQQPLEMTYQTAKDAADFYAKNALEELVVPEITFFGGEPMLRYDDIIKPLVEYIRATYADYNLSMTTNGTLLDEEKLKFLKDNDVGIMVSIDGDQETQDYNRPYHDGRGSFEDIDVELILKYYPDMVFRATLDPQTVDKLYHNYCWAESVGYKQATFIVNVFSEWSESQVEVLKAELDSIYKHIAAKIRADEPYMPFTEFDRYRHLVRRLDDGLPDGYYRDGAGQALACGTCGLGASRWGSIGSSGDIYSCQEMTENPEHTEFIIGNIYTGVDDIRRLELAESFSCKRVKSSKMDRCQSCALNAVCDGGCVINNYFNTSSFEIRPEIGCIYAELCFENAKKLRTVSK